MARIIINLLTFRDSCCNSPRDLLAFDRAQRRIFEKLGAELILGFGMEFEVDQNGQGARSYRVVDVADQADEANAHELMQDFDFWAHY